MADLVRVHRALISVSDKRDLIPFARGLTGLGIEIISTGGTARALAIAGIEAMPIEHITGYPEMMDGRVKSLHPAVHGGILARRDVQSHTEALERHGIRPIDLVCINLYPFEQTVACDEVTDAEAIEQIDIGGPAMLRSAAKNFDWVTVLTSPEQYDRVINELRAHDGHTTHALRRDLAAVAFSRTSAYDTSISAWMSESSSEALPTAWRMDCLKALDLRYGENPHQRAAAYIDYARPERGVIDARVLHGKPLSFNNLNDAAAALELITDLHLSFPDHAAAAVIKHANPCGAAVADDQSTAFARAYAGDPLAAYGGILAFNQPVATTTAERIAEGEKFLEVIVAPAYDDAALETLAARWKNVRLLAIGGLDEGRGRRVQYRSVPGGLLVQDRDSLRPDAVSWRHAAGPAPSGDLLREAEFAWLAAKHLKSNAIAITADRQLIGAGMGQVDRVTSCRLAVERAREAMSGFAAAGRPIVAASDAFFPFSDGPRLLLDAGVTALIHPGGSIRDQETIDLCNERGVTCLLTGVRHFRH